MCREITYYTCTALMFLFGLKMIWEAWRMGGDEAEETRREVEEELGVADTNRWGMVRFPWLLSKANSGNKHLL